MAFLLMNSYIITIYRNITLSPAALAVTLPKYPQDLWNQNAQTTPRDKFEENINLFI